MISCICPTANRRAYLPTAIDCFLRQTYTDSELIILDDGIDRVEDLIPPGGRVRYYHTQTRRSVGVKRNMACQQARGEVIAHWDDDDWSAPDRLETQFALLSDSDDAPMTGYHTLPFYRPSDSRAFLYRNGGKHYACGTSFMYWTKWWRGHPFLDMETSEDNTFLRACGSPPCTDGSQMMVALMHDTNTCKMRDENVKQIGKVPHFAWSDLAIEQLPEGFKERMGLVVTA